jgi:hypothetical protein
MQKRLMRGARLIIPVVLILLSGCDKFRNDPGFIGTWQFTEQITADNIVYNTIRTIDLTKSSWEETYIIQRQTSPDPSAIIGTRGKLGMSHTSLVFYLEDLGTCILNESDVCTGEVQWFGEGSVYWNLNIQYFQKAVAGEYEVSGTTLILKRDLNNDGDYADTGENVSFQMI